MTKRWILLAACGMVGAATHGAADARPATPRAPAVPDATAPPRAEAATAGYRFPERERFDAWVKQGHTSEFAAFEELLRAEGVADVLPMWTLWYQGTDWTVLGAAPFTVPPREDWSRVVATLRLIRDHVVPTVGPVRVVSGYRTADYNVRAGGAKHSAHLRFGAFDLVPERGWGRAELVDELLRLHARVEPSARFGLGIYSGLRFHVDTTGRRYWPRAELDVRSRSLGL